MSYIYDSSTVKDPKLNPFSSTKTEVKQKDDSSSIEIFKNDLPGAQDETVKQEQNINVKIDAEELYKEYKKNPTAILDKIGIFNEEQKKQLSEMLADKKDLKSFLEIIEKGGLKTDDVISAMKKVKEKAPSGFFKRVGNVIKKTFTDGISEAVKLAKSETVYYSDKLSENMENIREKRDDFSSEGLANVGDIITQNEELKEPTMHFVEKQEISGKKLYDENSVVKAAEIMQQNPKDAIEFKNNAIELESIKDENGHIKYKGETIIDVDQKMIENKELKPTMMKTAKKRDMNDEYLVGITDNLVTNPDMQEALDKILECKDKNGNDRFSARNMFDQSTYMVDKNKDKIIEYLNNTIELAKENKLSGDNIVNISGKITDYPEIKNAILTKIANKQTSGDTIVEYANKLVDAPQTNSYNSQQNQTTNTNVYQNTTNPIAAETYKNVANNQINNNNAAQTTEKKYTRQEISQFLTRKLGSIGDLLLAKVEENPNIIPLLKKYSGNKELITALIKNPDCLNKITSISSSVTTDQLAQFVKLCTSAEKTETVLKLIKDFGPQKALQLAEKSAQIKNQDQLVTILDNNTIRLSDKKAQIQNLVENKSA